MDLDEYYTLTAERVAEVFEDCLMDEGDEMEDQIKVEGMTIECLMHKDRVPGYAEEIAHMLRKLPEEFQGGESFEYIHKDVEGRVWGGYQDCDKLLALGIASEQAELRGAQTVLIRVKEFS